MEATRVAPVCYGELEPTFWLQLRAECSVRVIGAAFVMDLEVSESA